MIVRASVAAAMLTLAALSGAAADPCVAPRVDIADWPIMRSPRVPGFTLRLPRSFTRDTGTTAPPNAARWNDAGRARLVLTHLGDVKSTTLPSSEGHTGYARCEDRVGSATAIIISYAESTPAGSVVVHARIQWPDGESVDVRADAADRAQLDQLVAAVRTVRRAGA